MSYAQVAQHHKEQREKQAKDKLTIEQNQPSSNKVTNTNVVNSCNISVRVQADQRDSREVRGRFTFIMILFRGLKSRIKRYLSSLFRMLSFVKLLCEFYHIICRGSIKYS